MKKVLSLFLILMVIGVFIGCSKEEATQSAAPQQAERQTQTAETPAGTDVEDAGQTFVADVVRHDYAAHQTRERVWADYVQNASGGRIKVNFLSRDAIAKGDTELLELVRAGEVTMGSIAEAGIGNVFPEINALSVPFIIPNAQVAARMLAQDSPFFKEIAEGFYKGANGQARMVGAHVNSFRNIYTVEPIRVPSDLEKYNVTIRVKEVPMTIAVWEALGAAAIGLPAGDRYMAMETGLISALEGGIASVYQIGAFEIADYATLLNYQFSGNYMIVNEDWYQSLPSSLKTVVQDGWLKAIWMETPVREYFDLQELEKLVAEGNTVIVPSAEELAQWRDIAVPTAREFLEDEIDTSWIDKVQDNVQRVMGELREMGQVINTVY